MKFEENTGLKQQNSEATDGHIEKRKAPTPDGGTVRRAFAAALPHTIPIFAGFWFIALAYGIYMNTSGFGVIYPMLMSLTIYAGSLEFVAVSILLAPFNPLQTAVVTLMIQARHLFYGISMLDKLKGIDWKKYYIIFGMCDETFSINYSAEIPENVDRGWFMFFVALLNHFYWFSGATIGGLLGSYISVNTTGLSFVMTAMFVCIFLEQWLKESAHDTAWIGIGVSAVCLIAFGADAFLLPAMIGILVLLTIFRKPIKRRGNFE